MTHTAWAQPGLCSMKELGVLLLPAKLVTSPLQFSPPAIFPWYPFKTWVQRNTTWSLHRKLHRNVETDTFDGGSRLGHYTTAPPLVLRAGMCMFCPES